MSPESPDKRSEPVEGGEDELRHVQATATDAEPADGSERGRRAAGHQPAKAKRRSFPWSDLVTTLAAFVLAFFVGALLMIFSDSEVRQTFTYFFARPGRRAGRVGGEGGQRVLRAAPGRARAATARSPRPRPSPPR